MAHIGMREMLEAGAHFGHQTQRWNPKMKPYIYGARNGIYIINLQETVGLFENAYDTVKNTVAKGGRVLFIGTKKQAQDVIREEATRAGQFWVNNRWLGGMLTNFKTIKGSVDRLRAIEKMSTDGTFERLPKKEVIRLTRELQKLEKNLAGIRDMTRLPALIFIIDPKKEHIAVQESRRLQIPITALVDTNCDPDDVDYVIPGNDDAIRSIKLFASRIADACLEGAKIREENLAARSDKSGGGDKPEETKARKGGPQVDIIRKTAPEAAEAPASDSADGAVPAAGEDAVPAEGGADASATPAEAAV